MAQAQRAKNKHTTALTGDDAGKNAMGDQEAFHGSRAPA
jgi:hypothetical protein